MYLEILLVIVVIVLIVALYFYWQVDYGIGFSLVKDGILIVWNKTKTFGDYVVKIGKESGKYTEYKEPTNQYTIKDNSLCPTYYVKIDDSEEKKISYNTLLSPTGVKIE